MQGVMGGVITADSPEAKAMVAAMPDLIPADLREPPELPAGCGDCRSTGWVRRHGLDVHHPDFGKYFPCPTCQEPAIRQRALEQIYDDLDMPAEYRALSFASYAALADPDLDALGKVRELAGGQPQSAYLYGGYGVGKTAFAWLLLREWIAQGAQGTLFVLAAEFLDRLRATYGVNATTAFDAVMDATKRATVLVLDDLGAGKIPVDDRGEWIREKVFLLVDYRDKHHLPTIYTSNFAIDRLAGPLGPRTVRRLAHQVGRNVIWVDGPDHSTEGIDQ